jgi:hypothetical protein
MPLPLISSGDSGQELIDDKVGDCPAESFSGVFV